MDGQPKIVLNNVESNIIDDVWPAMSAQGLQSMTIVYVEPRETTYVPLLINLYWYIVRYVQYKDDRTVIKTRPMITMWKLADRHTYYQWSQP